ncbi:unnamed protein product [Calicophoron daubneyi]|uniref:Uncharacterized protein n=1 Tax=Calicophoron daubneyi TaxID=300641 RepID=A0AAV2T2C8_CALDB
MKLIYLLTLLPAALAIAVDDGCGRYDRSDKMGFCEKANLCGPFCGYLKGGECQHYDKRAEDKICADILGGGKYGICDNDFNENSYCLDAGLCAKGKFCGRGNDDRGRCFEQVAKFRRGAGIDSCGKKKRYSDYDTCGKMKRYADKNWHAKVGLLGNVYARGKYDLTGESANKIDFTDFGNANVHGNTQVTRDYADRQEGAFEGEAAGLRGRVQGRGGFSHADSYERHDVPERTPDLCGRYCDRCGRTEPCYRCDTCRGY